MAERRACLFGGSWERSVSVQRLLLWGANNVSDEVNGENDEK